MKGNIQVIQNYGDSRKVIFKQDNMAVDGIRKTIADVMTYMPDPSGFANGVVYQEPGVSSVSSYQVQAVTLGSAKEYYDKRDTRFWYSATEYSSYNYQQLPLTPDDYFEMYDSYSGIGYNSWQYSDRVSANILKSSNLAGPAGILSPAGVWEVLYKKDPTPDPISQRMEGFGESSEPVTRFELIQGQQSVTLRQPVPFRLGQDYYVYTHGKAYEATFDFRVGRGRAGIVFEYYDFTTRRFVPKTDLKANTRNTTLLSDIFAVNEFRFQLRGHELDQWHEVNNEYFVEYVFPAKSFVDTNFSPWEEDAQNPYVDIVELEVCDASHQILQNPNFLTRQSRMGNNDFKYTVELTKDDAEKPGACNSLGYRSIIGWSLVNPILDSFDPATEELNDVFGNIKPASTSHLENTVFSSMIDGVVLHTSGTDVADFSGGVALSQSFALGDVVRNDFAFPNSTSQDPTNLNAANGQADNNSTLMLSFETMVSGAGTAANSGHLEISLLRNSDGFFYTFDINPNTNVSNKFEPANVPLLVPYSEKDAWLEVGVPVVLPPDANRDAYTLTIKASGRSDAAHGGFCNYAIKDFCFGELQGWRTYMYDQSSVASWGLSSTGYSQMQSGFLYSGLSFSGPVTQEYGWSAGYIEAVNNPKTAFKNQIVQNFVGLEPTKSYRLSLKGTLKNDTWADGGTGQFQAEDSHAFLAILKARGKWREPGKNNILSQYMQDSVTYSGATYPISNLNPYSNDGQSFRRTFPQFQKTLDDSTTKPTDWGVLLRPASTNTGRFKNAAFENTRGDGGAYYLSMDVFNSHPEGSYFVLSSAPNVFFNWESRGWDNITTTLPSYRSSTSGAYFLPLPKTINQEDYTTFEYPYAINLQDINLTPTNDPTPLTAQPRTATGFRGKYKITAGLFGPNATEGETLVKNISLAGVGEGRNVDIWKDLYYQWDTGEWSPTVDSDNLFANQSRLGDERNFIATPVVDVANMCLYGLGKDTEYQLNIVNVSGGEFTLNDVTLTDTSLIANPGKDKWVRDPSIFTSEFYGNAHYNKYTNGTVFKYYSTLDNVSDPSSITTPLPLFASPRFRSIGQVAASNAQYGVPCIEFRNVDTTRPRYPWLLRNFTLAEYDLEAYDKFAFGLDVLCTSKVGNPIGYLSLETRYGGVSYHYDFTSRTWIPGSMRREKSFPLDVLGGGLNADVTSRWTKIASPEVTAPSFGTTTKIIASLRCVPDTVGNTDIIMKDFRVYKTIEATRHDNTLGAPTEYRVSGDTFLFPEFPTPMDESLQSKGKAGTPGELGHFLNRIPYFHVSSFALNEVRTWMNPGNASPTGEKTFEEAVANGAYLPSGGFYFGPGAFGTSGTSGLISGTLNTMGVLNSDGYIYQHPHAVTNEFDSSAGFITSSYIEEPYAGWTHKPKVVRYVLKVHKDDWKFVDYYMGGIGALGLNVFDYTKTYEKLGTSLMVSSTNEAYSQGSRVALYNVADPSRNPVFRLTNKKATFAPGLHIDYQNTDWLTIIWDIDFLK